ncbi:hypothetical protein VPHD239_0096 [Vibrio phage D239]
MSIMSPSELVNVNLARNAANVEHVTSVINKALAGLRLLPGDNKVTDLYLCGASVSDRPLIERLLAQAGYRSVSTKARNAGRNETDILVSFFIPQ